MIHDGISSREVRVFGLTVVMMLAVVLTASASMSSTNAGLLAQEAIRRAMPGAKTVAVACRVSPTDTATCNARWKLGARRYIGTVTLEAGNKTTTYRVKATGKRKGYRDKRVSKSGNLPSPTPALGTRENPIPRGTTAAHGDWRITVTGTTPDATQQVMAENQFNDPPSEGRQFFIARVRGTYTGKGSEGFNGSYRLRAVGGSAVEYATFRDSCGVIPDPIPSGDVFTGGTVEGNVCWQIRSTDAGSLVMFDEPLSAKDRVFFAL